MKINKEELEALSDYVFMPLNCADQMYDWQFVKFVEKLLSVTPNNWFYETKTEVDPNNGEKITKFTVVLIRSMAESSPYLSQICPKSVKLHKVLADVLEKEMELLKLDEVPESLEVKIYPAGSPKAGIYFQEYEHLYFYLVGDVPKEAELGEHSRAHFDLNLFSNRINKEILRIQGLI